MTKKSDPETELARLQANTEAGPVRLVGDERTGDQFLIYATEAGLKVELHYKGDALWMTQGQIAELFGRDVSVVSRHIANVFDEGELSAEGNLQKMQIANATRPTTLYGLDVVISVGYRVSSKQATLFRRWATATLVQFATKGFVVDVRRLKDPSAADRFDELREVIRDIRASEANVYREVRRICSLCSDYAALDEPRKNRFFATIQNKLHYAVTGQTGAEIRISRADASKPNMGLTTWAGDYPTQRDAMTAKNFLGPVEIRDLNRFTGMLLDYFEQETELGRLVVMSDAEFKLNTFIRNNERPLLQNAGSVSKKAADDHAKRQYDIFNEMRRRVRHNDPNQAD